MEFKIDLGVLQKAVRRNASVLAAKETIPALSYLLLAGYGDYLILAGNDLDVYQEIIIPGVVAETFEIGIHGKKLQAGLELFTPGEITVKIDGNEVRLKQGRREIGMTTLAADQLPARVAPVTDPKALNLLNPQIDGAVLAEMIRLVLPAVAKMDYKSGLDAVVVRHEGEFFSTLAIDGVIANYATIPAMQGATAGHCFIPWHLASKTVTALKDAGIVKVASGGTKAYFCFGDGFLALSQPQKKLRNYDGPIREWSSHPNVLTTRRDTFSAPLVSLVKFCDEKSNALPVHVCGDNGELWLKTNTDKGIVELPLGAHPWQGQFLLPISSLLPAIQVCRAEEMAVSWIIKSSVNQNGKTTFGAPIAVATKETVGDTVIEFKSFNCGMNYEEE